MTDSKKFKTPINNDTYTNSEESINNDTYTNSEEGRFNIKQFNKNFKMEKKILEEEQSIESENLSPSLNSQTIYVNKNQPVWNNSLVDIFRGMGNSCFFLLNDLMGQKYKSEMLTKDNRLFYIGLTLILVALVISLCCYVSY